MKPIGTHNYFVYILTNKNRTVLYTVMTENLVKRIHEHIENAEIFPKHFTGRYNCFYLIHFERYNWVEDAMKREFQIKGWSRKKKEDLINETNPSWNFLNDEIQD